MISSYKVLLHLLVISLLPFMSSSQHVNHSNTTIVYSLNNQIQTIDLEFELHFWVDTTVLWDKSQISKFESNEAFSFSNIDFFQDISINYYDEKGTKKTLLLDTNVACVIQNKKKQKFLIKQGSILKIRIRIYNIDSYELEVVNNEIQINKSKQDLKISEYKFVEIAFYNQPNNGKKFVFPIELPICANAQK